MKKISVLVAVALFSICAVLPQSTYALTINQNLSVGSTGSQVTALQLYLGFLNLLKTSPTGYYGILTEKAVAELQTMLGINPVGSVGPITRQALGNATTTTSTTAPTTTTTSTTTTSPATTSTTITPPPVTTPVVTPPVTAPVVTTPVTTTSNVSGVAATPSTLSSVLAAAVPGETIVLAPGAYTQQINFQNKTFSTPITITSANTSNEAVISRLDMSGVSGVVFSNIEFNTTQSTDGYYASRIYSSDHITFNNIYMHGNTSTTDPSSQLTGIYIANSSYITFTNSKFAYLTAAIDTQEVTNLTVTNNYFTEMDKGGFVIGWVNGATISNNYFDNFFPSAGTHSDVIQFFTANATTSMQNITISNNLFNRGSGNAAQGIFMGDENGLGYTNVTITGNEMIGNSWQSITLEDGHGNINVSNNTIASWAGYDDVSTTATQITNFVGWIFLRGDFSQATVTEQNNQAQEYVDLQGSVQTVPSSNVILPAVTDNGAALISSWLATHSNVGPSWINIRSLSSIAGLPASTQSTTTNQNTTTTNQNTTTTTSTGTTNTNTTTTSTNTNSNAGTGTVTSTNTSGTSTVSPTAVPTVTFTTSVAPSANTGVYVPYGSKITLTWTTTNATYCVGRTENTSDSFNGTLPASGSFTDTITNGRHYYISCGNGNATGYVPGAAAYYWVSATGSSQSAAVGDAVSQIIDDLKMLTNLLKQ